MQRLFLALLSILFFSNVSLASDIKSQYGVAMHGSPKYAADFQHLEYTNPDAPKGGAIRFAAQGTFDSLNPYIIKGMPVSAVGGLVYQTLMTNTEDEAFSEYGLIVKTIEMPEDRSWVVFNLRETARWHDGHAITADDVVWSFQTLIKKGHPFYRAYYANVKEVKAEAPTRVKFIFNMAGNRELPLIIGQMPVLPKHFWEGKDFSKSNLDIPLGSGPYKVASVDTGRRITFERVEDWWAKDLPIMKGKFNFDKIVFDYFRDETVILQALFSGDYDFREERIAKTWNAEYDVPAVKSGLIKKEEIKHSQSAGMQAFVLNTRRPMFKDIKTRKALNYVFDFEWSNKQFAYGGYKRTESYFANSELASSGVPEGRELEILKSFEKQLPPELFTQEFKLPKTSGSGKDMRKYLKQAKTLLKEAGWKMGSSGLLERDGHTFKIEFLVRSDTFARWINPIIGNMKKLGIKANLRVVDTAQYQKRLDNFDFDIVGNVFGQSQSPGNEQRDFWSSEKADVKGSRNLMGVKNPVVDKLIDLVIEAPNREELIVRTHALDRVLLWHYYVIPQWHLNYFRFAYWDKFGRPAISPKYGRGVIDTWWYDTEKAAKISGNVKQKEK